MPRFINKYTFLYLLFTLCLLSILACNQTESITSIEPVVEQEDSSLLFQTFLFETKNNPQLPADVTFTIDGNILRGNLKHYFSQAIPTFTSNAAKVEINGVEQVSASNAIDFSKPITYTLTSATGGKKQYTVAINWDTNLAKVDILTGGKVPITSKNNYLPATINIDGQTKYCNFTGTAKIRGRGNSTWTFPKKPYKIKLDSDAEILGLAAEKDWVLLANYLDGTHLLNAVSMKAGQLLEMPFTNTIIPVEVTLNDEFLGLYMLTEQVEVKKNRVNVGKEGILLNIDTNFDDPWQFQSAAFRLPVMIKNPKLKSPAEVQPIKKQFEELEALVASDTFPNNQYLDSLDGESVAKYLIVYMLMDNEEINHPKSTYIHKTPTGKFTMGPIWDFDWAFAFEGSLEHFSNFAQPLFWSPPSKGTQFFSKLMTDPAIRQLMKDHWATFRTNDFADLLRYVDEYAFIIESARNRDRVLWQQGSSNFYGDVASLKNWLSNRAGYMDRFIGEL